MKWSWKSLHALYRRLIENRPKRVGREAHEAAVYRLLPVLDTTVRIVPWTVAATGGDSIARAGRRSLIQRHCVAARRARKLPLVPVGRVDALVRSVTERAPVGHLLPASASTVGISRRTASARMAALVGESGCPIPEEPLRDGVVAGGERPRRLPVAASKAVPLFPARLTRAVGNRVGAPRPVTPPARRDRSDFDRMLDEFRPDWLMEKLATDNDLPTFVRARMPGMGVPPPSLGEASTVGELSSPTTAEAPRATGRSAANLAPTRRHPHRYRRTSISTTGLDPSASAMRAVTGAEDGEASVLQAAVRDHRVASPGIPGSERPTSVAAYAPGHDVPAEWEAGWSLRQARRRHEVVRPTAGAPTGPRPAPSATSSSRTESQGAAAQDGLSPPAVQLLPMDEDMAEGTTAEEGGEASESATEADALRSTDPDSGGVRGLPRRKGHPHDDGPGGEAQLRRDTRDQTPQGLPEQPRTVENRSGPSVERSLSPAEPRTSGIDLSHAPSRPAAAPYADLEPPWWNPADRTRQGRAERRGPEAHAAPPAESRTTSASTTSGSPARPGGWHRHADSPTIGIPAHGPEYEAFVHADSATHMFVESDAGPHPSEPDSALARPRLIIARKPRLYESTEGRDSAAELPHTRAVPSHLRTGLHGGAITGLDGDDANYRDRHRAVSQKDLSADAVSTQGEWSQPRLREVAVGDTLRLREETTIASLASARTRAVQRWFGDASPELPHVARPGIPAPAPRVPQASGPLSAGTSSTNQGEPPVGHAHDWAGPGTRSPEFGGGGFDGPPFRDDGPVPTARAQAWVEQLALLTDQCRRTTVGYLDDPAFLDALARRLYERVLAHIRRELVVDRERVGLLASPV